MCAYVYAHDADDGAGPILLHIRDVAPVGRLAHVLREDDGEALQLPEHHLVRLQLGAQLATHIQRSAAERRRFLSVGDARQRDEEHVRARTLAPAQHTVLAWSAAPRSAHPREPLLAQPLVRKVGVGAHLELATRAVRTENDADLGEAKRARVALIHTRGIRVCPT